jgi:hypothetical protein
MVIESVMLFQSMELFSRYYKVDYEHKTYGVGLNAVKFMSSDDTVDSCLLDCCTKQNVDELMRFEIFHVQDACEKRS